MAFSQRAARRVGAFSAMAPQRKLPEESFAGEWLDDDGSVVTVKGSQIIGPDGSMISLQIKNERQCLFFMDGEAYEGSIDSDGRLTWSDGCIWTRGRSTGAATSDAQNQVAETIRLRVDEDLRHEAEEHERKLEESRRRREQQRQEAADEARRRVEEATRRRKAAEDEEQNRQESQVADVLCEGSSGPATVQRDSDADTGRSLQTHAVDHVSEAVICKIEQVAQDPSAEKCGANETKIAQADDGSNEKVFLGGSGKSMMSEDEATRLQLAAKKAEEDRKAKEAQETSNPEFAAAKAKSQAGLEKARAAFETEKARKAAALERVRAEKARAAAEAEASQASLAGTSASSEKVQAEGATALQSVALNEGKKQAAVDFEIARAKSQAGLDKARQAREAERARKAAALERVRAEREAKAAAEAEKAKGEKASVTDAMSQAGVDAEDAKEKCQAGLEEARQARLSEPARHAFALEHIRSVSEGSIPGEKVQRTFASEAGAHVVELRKRPSSFEAAATQAQASARAMLQAGSEQEASFVQEQSSLPQRPKLETGTLVRLSCLFARPELNGLLGELVSFDESRDRWVVAVEGMDSNCNLKSSNFTALTHEELEEIQTQRMQDSDSTTVGADVDLDSLMNKLDEVLGRWRKAELGDITESPGANGNKFDISIGHSLHGRQVAEVLKRRGFCRVEANIGDYALLQAFEEAERLWDEGCFHPPMQDMGASELEAALWQRILYSDEDNVAWISDHSPYALKMRFLLKLANHMKEFAAGIGQQVARTMDIHASGMWEGCLTCYTGSRTYNFHLDNPHSLEECSLPDNGVRLTLALFINPHWSPEEGYNGGGLDVFLTDPTTKPASMAAVCRAKRVRIGPHADTLVAFLSERIGHQVIQTENSERWFCLWLWTVDEHVISQFPFKFLEHQGIAVDGAWGGDGDISDNEIGSGPPSISNHRGDNTRGLAEDEVLSEVD